MRAFVKKHRKHAAVLGCIAMLVALVEAWSAAAPLRGQMAARFDLPQGRCRILTYGLPPSWLPEYAGLLKERYGVEVHPVAGCIVSKSLSSYVDNYDAVSAAAANHKYGHDILKECSEDARKSTPGPDGVSLKAREP